MISAIVPTYRGAGRLTRNLPSVCRSLEASGQAWEVLVVDDGGGALPALPTGARVVAMTENRGYGPAVNAGAAAARGEQLLILNDDVRLEPGTVTSLARHLCRDGVFAVVPRIRSPLTQCGDEGGKAGVLRAGLIEILESPSEVPHPTLYPVGCCSLCRADVFRALGGYDDVFAPFFWEDVDLGFRAWRRGFASLHAPDAACDHEGSATLSEQRSHAERERIEFRNRVLFHLRNRQGRAERAASLGALAAFALFEGRPARQAGLAEALARYATAPARPVEGLSDAEVLARSSAA